MEVINPASNELDESEHLTKSSKAKDAEKELIEFAKQIPTNCVWSFFFQKNFTNRASRNRPLS